MPRRGQSTAQPSRRRVTATGSRGVPQRDFAGVSAPTLGIFFESDESSPPESPSIFLRGRLRGPNDDVTVLVLPNTTHEGFVIDGPHTAAGQASIERIAPEIYAELRRWVGLRALQPQPR